MTSLSHSRGRGVEARTLAVRTGVALALSALANAAIVATVRSQGIGEGFMPLSYPPVVALTVVGVLGASAVYWALARREQNPDRVFAAVAAVVLVLSFVPDLVWLPGSEGATTEGITALMAMHVVVAAVCVAVLTGWAFE